MACIDVAAEPSDFNCDDVGKASMCLPRLYGDERFQADFRRRSKWRHEFALCEGGARRIRLLQMRSRVQSARVRQLDHTSTVPDHSAGSDSDTALVFTFRLRAASHRQMT